MSQMRNIVENLNKFDEAEERLSELEDKSLEYLRQNNFQDIWDVLRVQGNHLNGRKHLQIKNQIKINI